MKHCRVFKSKKTNEYDLCCFYQVGLTGDLPSFPSPHELATRELLSNFLLKARVLGHPNLVVAFMWDSATAICLLQELHIKDSLRRLLMEPKGGCWWEGYQEAVLLPTLYVFGQQQHLIHEPHNVWTLPCKLRVWAMHLKVCVGLPKEAKDHTSTSPVKERTSKDHSPNSQLPPPQSSQGSSQASLHRSQYSKKKPALTPKKAGSTTKSSKSCKEKSCKKASKKSSQDKHHNKEMLTKEKHRDKDQVDKGKSDKSSKK